MHEYPVCGKHTDKIHDYRKHIIKNIPAFEKFVSQEARIPFFRVSPTITIDIEQKKHPTLMCGVLEIIFC
jgi:transposase